jgi:hypothetical protein
MFPWSRTLVCRRIVVNLTTGRAFEGLLITKRGPLLVLRDAVLLEPGADPTPVDGEIVIERRRVEFIQNLGSG